MAQANLGVNYRDAGRLQEGIALLEEALDRARKRPPPFLARFRRFPVMLARAYDQAGLFAKAEPLYRQALADAKEQFGADSRETADRLGQLGRHLLQVQQPTEAERVLRECLAIREKKEPDTWTTFDTKSMLGAALFSQKKYAEAEPLLAAGYEGMKQREARIPPIERGLVAEALQRLVQLYEATGQNDKADAWRKKLAETRTPLPGPEKK
jgi:tetratricopeptide (TPR) repeat protein